MDYTIRINCPYCGRENRYILNALSGNMLIRCGAVIIDDRLTQYDKYYRSDGSKAGCGSHFFIEWSPNVKIKRIEGEGKDESIAVKDSPRE